MPKTGVRAAEGRRQEKLVNLVIWSERQDHAQGTRTQKPACQHYYRLNYWWKELLRTRCG